jgi:hypothetical protein
MYDKKRWIEVHVGSAGLNGDGSAIHRGDKGEKVTDCENHGASSRSAESLCADYTPEFLRCQGKNRKNIAPEKGL